MFDGEVSVAASSLMSQARLNLTRHLKDKSEYMLLCYITFTNDEDTIQIRLLCIMIIVLVAFTEPI